MGVPLTTPSNVSSSTGPQSLSSPADADVVHSPSNEWDMTFRDSDVVLAPGQTIRSKNSSIHCSERSEIRCGRHTVREDDMCEVNFGDTMNITTETTPGSTHSTNIELTDSDTIPRRIIVNAGCTVDGLIDQVTGRMMRQARESNVKLDSGLDACFHHGTLNHWGDRTPHIDEVALFEHTNSVYNNCIRSHGKGAIR